MKVLHQIFCRFGWHAWIYYAKWTPGFFINRKECKRCALTRWKDEAFEVWHDGEVKKIGKEMRVCKR